MVNFLTNRSPSFSKAVMLAKRSSLSNSSTKVERKNNEPNEKIRYPHAIVAGIERYPRKVTRRMGQKKVARRSKVKPFIKVRSRHGSPTIAALTSTLQIVNYSHLFPTRYALELEGLKGVVTYDTFKEPSQRENAKKTIKKLFEDRYTTGKNKWFFQPLRVSCSARLRLTFELNICLQF
jgi:large subunit ribosomal protein L27e